MEVHERDFFQHNGVVNRLVRVLAPGKGAVAVDEDSGNRSGVFALEGLNDHIAGFFFIFACNFFRGHLARAGNFTVEIIALRRAERLDADACLRKARCPAAVRMDNTAAFRECLVAHQMRRCVAQRLPFSLDDLAVQIDHDHIRRRHAVIRHAGGLDDHQAALPVDA